MAARLETHSDTGGSMLAWVAVLLGPIAWTVHLLVAYFLVPTTCDASLPWLLHLTTIVTAVASLAAVPLAWREMGRSAESRNSGNQGSMQARRFLGISGMALGLLFAAVVVLEGIPPVLLSPCA
jgi:hypothetical protein